MSFGNQSLLSLPNSSREEIKVIYEGLSTPFQGITILTDKNNNNPTLENNSKKPQEGEANQQSNDRETDPLRAVP